MEVWLCHTIDGAVLYGYCLNFFNRKATPLSIKNISILPISMVVPFLKSLVSPFLLFKGMALTYLQEVISWLFIQDSSASYLKDLERFRNNPSYDVFEKVIRYFNLSADTVIYPNENLTNTTYQQIERLLTRCDEGQLRVILATTEALLSESEMPSDSE